MEEQRNREAIIEKFLIQSHLGSILDFEKIAKLPQEEFKAFHLALMQEYKDYDLWWTPGKMPYCTRCNNEIDSPKNLRRYYGATLHPGCFELFRNDINFGHPSKEFENDNIKPYWDRVENLVYTD